MKLHLMSCAPLILLACWCVSPVWAQQEEPPRRLSQQQGDGQEEMIQLFGKVERRLKEIDALLNNAAAGDTKQLRDAGLSSMDQLLKRTAQSSREVQQDIDRLLELARQAGQPNGSGGGSGQQQSNGSSQGQSSGQQSSSSPSAGSSSPLDGRSEQSTQREATPEMPQAGGQQQRDSSQPSGAQPQGQPSEGQQPSGGSQPTAGRANPAQSGANQQGGDPTGSARGSAAEAQQADRWGDLPVHARDVFRSQGGRELPPRYRDAIDGYYRKLNKRP
ncbi:MAG: hypothetical protein RIT40_2397 [Planctomycetota bacterium]